MNYKEKIESLKSFFLSSETEPKEVVSREEVMVELMDEAPADAAPATEPAPAEYVTLAQFNELRENTEKFMNSVTEMLSSAMEMINSTEKNAVPVEASKQEVEEIELAAEPITHDPEAVVSNNTVKVKLNGGEKKTAGQRAFETWVNAINKN